MTSQPHESHNLFSYLDLEEDLDYDSDSTVHVDEGTLFKLPVPEVRPLTASNPFVERGETTAPVAKHDATDAGERIITNPLDEQQDLILHQGESDLRRAQTKRVIQNRNGYLFSTPDMEESILQSVGRSLSTWSI